MRITKMTAPVAIAAAALLGLTACGGDDPTPEPPAVEEETTEEAPEEEAPEEDTTDEEAPEEDNTDEESDDETDEADAAPTEGGTPAWSTEAEQVGESLGTIELGDVTVEVFEVAIDQATRSSIWADPDTDEPIVAEGDDVVIYNYVVTNNGDPVNLSYGLLDIGMDIDSWPYMQQPSVSDSTLLERHGINYNAVNGDSIGEDVYVLGTGQSYSIGQVMLHQPGEAYTIEAELVIRDDAGERTGDRIEGELTGTMN